METNSCDEPTIWNSPHSPSYLDFSQEIQILKGKIQWVDLSWGLEGSIIERYRFSREHCLWSVLVHSQYICMSQNVTQYRKIFLKLKWILKKIYYKKARIAKIKKLVIWKLRHMMICIYSHPPQFGFFKNKSEFWRGNLVGGFHLLFTRIRLWSLEIFGDFIIFKTYQNGKVI